MHETPKAQLIRLAQKRIILVAMVSAGSGATIQKQRSMANPEKTEVAKLTSITIKKVWNTDETSKVPDSVTVQLLRNGSVVKTATLNAHNQWQVTFPDMPESDDYSVREINIPQGFTVTYAQNGYSYTVTNTAALIQTGQLTWPIPAFAIIGVVLLAVGTVILRKERQ